MNPEFRFTKPLQDKVSLWIESASAAMSLIGGNTKTRDEATKDIADFLLRDSKHNLLRAIKVARAKISKAGKSMEELLSFEGVSDLERLDPVVQCLELAIPEAVQTELTTDAFDDIVSCQCAAYSNKLHSLQTSATDLCRQFENEAENCWKKDLPAECPFADILHACETSVYGLQGKALKTGSDEFLEAFWEQG